MARWEGQKEESRAKGRAVACSRKYFTCVSDALSTVAEVQRQMLPRITHLFSAT